MFTPVFQSEIMAIRALNSIGMVNPLAVKKAKEKQALNISCRNNMPTLEFQELEFVPQSLWADLDAPRTELYGALRGTT